MGLKDFFFKCLRIFLDTFSILIYGVWHWMSGKTSLPPISNDLVTLPATVLAHKIRSRKMTSEEVVTAFIERIGEVNSFLNAVVQTRFEEAIKEAKDVDVFLRSTGQSEGELAKQKPFLGVPFTVKDFYAVKGLKLTSGLYARKDHESDYDADCVRLMKTAGAILLAVTNVPELCMWYTSHNKIYGRTRNPYDLTRIPGGSSGGEASNQSAGGSPLSIGSDIAGSIRMPSFFCGLFGHKGTSSVVSNAGSEPEMVGAHLEYSVTGPICRYTCDLVAMFRVLAANNTHLLSLDKKVNLKNLKVYYMEDDGGSPFSSSVDKEIKAALLKVTQHFRETYNVYPVKVNIEYFKNALRIYLTKYAEEKEAVPWAVELANREGEISVWTECFKCLFGMSNHTVAGLFMAVFEKLYEENKDDPQILEDFENMNAEFTGLLKDDAVFLYPTHPTTATYHTQTLFRPFNWTYTGIINLMGLPATNCPLGLDSRGLPLGIQVVANKYQDHLCLAVAEDLEKAFGGWVNPCPVIEPETEEEAEET